MFLRFSRGSPRRAGVFALILLCAGALLMRILCYTKEEEGSVVVVAHDKYVAGPDGRTYEYNRNMPLIFIGGVPRSGTTLMRAMLDAHPDIRCGQETRVIPRLLQMRYHWLKHSKENMRLEQAGITKPVLDSAIAAFILEVIAKHGEPAPRLCNKDPLTIKMGTYVMELFPNAKFIFMLRDGRATVHSIISRKVTITGFDLTSYRQCLKKWNTAIESMNEQCKELGGDKCLRVPYEQLVLHPRNWMDKVLKFLNITWDESVLHHEDFINKGIELSNENLEQPLDSCFSPAWGFFSRNVARHSHCRPKNDLPNLFAIAMVERSSDQVIKPVNLEALTKWVGHIPDDVVKDMADIAPMLSVLGYDPYANPPNYGKPDAVVADNTRHVQKEKEIWDKKAKEMFSMKLDSDGDTTLNMEPSDFLKAT